MPLDLQLKNYLIKKNVQQEKDKRQKRNEEIKQLPYDERAALAMEMGFNYIPEDPEKTKTK